MRATGVGDLAPPRLDAEFGGGRVLPIRGGSSPAPNIAMGVTRVGEGGYRVFAFDDFRAPADNDLQLLAMAETSGGDRVAVLQFLHPILRRTQFLGVSVEHTVALDLTSPEGDTVAVELRPDGTTVAVVNGTDRPEPPVATVVGTDALFVVPSTFGVTPDWTVSARVTITSADTAEVLTPDVTGYTTSSVPVFVGDLTGENPAVTLTATDFRTDGERPFAPAELADPLGRGDVRVDGQDLEIAIEHPLVQQTTMDGAELSSLAVGVDLIPPGYAFGSTPVSVTAEFTPPGFAAPTPVTVRSGAATVGTVPIAVEDGVVRFHLGDFQPATAQGGPGGAFRLGVDSAEFTIDAFFDPSAGGAPFEEQITVRLSGVGIAIQRADSDRVAVGTVDPAAFSFTAVGDTEFWAGTLRGDLVATYTEIGTPGPSSAGTGPAAIVAAASTGASGFGIPWLPDVLNQAADAPSGWHHPVPPPDSDDDVVPPDDPALPDDPAPPADDQLCRAARYSVKSSDNRFPTDAPPQRFALPRPEDGFDQNRFATNYEFGRFVSRHWTPSCAAGGSAFGSAAAPVSRVVPLAAGVDRADAGPPPDLRDLDDDWLVCPRVVVTSFDRERDHIATAQKGAPCVRVDLLTGASRAGTPDGAAGPDGASPEGASPDGASSDGGDGSLGAPALVGAGVLALIAVGVVVVRRRRRPAGGDA